MNKRDRLKWLDVGCGLGYLVKEAEEEGIDAYGIEISEHALSNAVIKGKIIQASITNIPFSNESFDVVSAIDVLEHIHPREVLKAVSEIYRVLKPGGLLIITTPNPCYIGDWIYDLTHINVRPLKYWSMILEKYCFKVKMLYVPSFLKYYILFKSPFIYKLISLIPEGLEFKLEEPLRYFAGWFFSRRGRLYILARKMKCFLPMSDKAVI